MKKVAFIGLGVMGYPMAGYLVQGGYEVSVYNRTASKAVRFVEEYSKAGKVKPSCYATPFLASVGCDVVLACVGNDNDLRAVTVGEHGAFGAMKEGAVFVDHTTASAGIARELAEMANSHKLGFVDAPVSGGQSGAESGSLTVMAGGSMGDFASVEGVIANYAKKCVRIGTVGTGQLTKMVNQICIAGMVQGLAEALTFGDKAGLDMEKVIDVVSGGAAQSWQLENRAHTMLKGQFDFGFAVEWMRKDLGIVLDTARDIDASLPVTALVDQYYAQLVAKGGSRWDTSSLINLLQNKRSKK